MEGKHSMAEVKKIQLEQVPVKTAGEHALTAAKYVATAATVATSVTGIIVFAFPNLQPISEYILSLITVVLNIGIVYFTKKSAK